MTVQKKTIHTQSGKICPKCQYRRKSSDAAPEYECPKCGIIYEKYLKKRESISKTSGTARKQDVVRGRRTLSVPIFVFVIISCIVIVYLIISNNLKVNKDEISVESSRSSYTVKGNAATNVAVHDEYDEEDEGAVDSDIEKAKRKLPFIVGKHLKTYDGSELEFEVNNDLLLTSLSIKHSEPEVHKLFLLNWRYPDVIELRSQEGLSKFLNLNREKSSVHMEASGYTAPDGSIMSIILDRELSEYNENYAAQQRRFEYVEYDDGFRLTSTTLFMIPSFAQTKNTPVSGAIKQKMYRFTFAPAGILYNIDMTPLQNEEIKFTTSARNYECTLYIDNYSGQFTCRGDANFTFRFDPSTL